MAEYLNSLEKKVLINIYVKQLKKRLRKKKMKNSISVCFNAKQHGWLFYLTYQFDYWRIQLFEIKLSSSWCHGLGKNVSLHPIVTYFFPPKLYLTKLNILIKTVCYISNRSLYVLCLFFFSWVMSSGSGRSLLEWFLSRAKHKRWKQKPDKTNRA